MGKQSLVALDTNHIKQYIFATSKLKEIRGASSILDHLNRRVMDRVAAEPAFHAQPVYANGGSGLFLIEGDADLAREFGLRIQQAYRRETSDGASITFVVQELPSGVQDAWHDNVHETLELLRYRLAERKVSWLPERAEDGQAGEQRGTEMLAFPSHPFMRTCDACGLRYAEGKDPEDPTDYYCAVCWGKRTEDQKVKTGIDILIDTRKRKSDGAGYKPFAWEKVIRALPEVYVHAIPQGTERPGDFNELRGMSNGKDYLALIYADGNGMGQLLQDLPTLAQVRDAAEAIDTAVYAAISFAISQHLPVVPREGRTPPRFPFDLLFIGGDDMMIVTPAAPALDIAISITQKFYELTGKRNPGGKGYTLSVGVVLAPVNYPFRMLHELVEHTIQFAKKKGAQRQNKQSKRSEYGDTLINFMTVTGSTSQEFSAVYQALHRKHYDEKKQRDVKFYATLRPYTVEELTILLNMIREGKGKGLGRTKLHQVREAVLKMNLTTSVDEGLSVLRNWRTGQREFVTGHVYTLGGRYQEPYHDPEQPGTLFPRVTFPWFADGPDIYRTSLLDFVELYDFVV